MMTDFAALSGAAAAIESNRRRPSLTPNPSQPSSSSRPGTTSSGSGPISRSRSRSTSATTTGSSSSTPIIPNAVMASPSPISSRYTGGPSGSSSSSRGLGLTTNDTSSLKAYQHPIRNIVEDSPTDPVFARPFTSMSSRTVLEEQEEEDEYEYDERDWEGIESERKRSRASTLSSPTGSTMLGGAIAGVRRKISDSKRIMRPLSPDSGGSTDMRMLKKQIKGGTPSTYSPLSAQTSSDEGSTSGSLIMTSQLELPQTMSFSHSKKIGRRQPPPLELSNPGSPVMSPKPSHEQLRKSMSKSTSALMLDKLSLSRPQSVPPSRELPPIASGSSTRPTTASTQKGGLEIPGGTLSTSLASSARISSINQPTVSTTGSKGGRTVSSVAIANFNRSDSNSSSGTNNTTVMNALSTINNNTMMASSSSSTTLATLHQQQPHKYLTAKDRKNSSKVSLAATARQKKHPPSLEPPMMDATTTPKVATAPASGMYWYQAPEHGQHRLALRAHTCTMVGSSIYVFGGCDRTCYNDMHIFDTDSMSWSKPTVYGEIPPPLRAMTTTAVNKKLVIFGGGDGPTYYNDVYVYDTVTSKYTRPAITGETPSRRRAHTACFYKNGIYIFGGGDGERALNDIWRLDVSDFNKLSWRCVQYPTNPRPGPSSSASVSGRTRNNGALTPSSTARPTARGYHTANMVGSKLIIYGGSDGTECFQDVWIFDVDTEIWKAVPVGVAPAAVAAAAAAAAGGQAPPKNYPRLSHTATIVGSYLFVVGGHDGLEYSSDVLSLNLVTMQWDRRKVYGLPPSGRGYHGAVLHDSRLFVIGGFDGQSVFSDTYILELALSSYYSQISHFTIEV